MAEVSRWFLGVARSSPHPGAVVSTRNTTRAATLLLLLATACTDDSPITEAPVEPPPPPPPGAVGQLRTAAMENRLAVSWQPPAGTATQYQIEACRDGQCDTTLVVNDTTEATVRLWEYYEWFRIRVRGRQLSPARPVLDAGGQLWPLVPRFHHANGP